MAVTILSLGYYKWPKKGRYAHKIGKDLVEITKTLGFTPFNNNQIKKNTGAAWFSKSQHAEVRMIAVPGSEGTQWHQDGDTTLPKDQMDFGLIVWASKDPTEVKSLNGNHVVTAKPFEILYISNFDWYHRRPPKANGKRWHFRQRVNKITDEQFHELSAEH